MNIHQEPFGRSILNREVSIICSLLTGIAIIERSRFVLLNGNITLDQRSQASRKVLRHRSRLRDVDQKPQTKSPQSDDGTLLAFPEQRFKRQFHHIFVFVYQLHLLGLLGGRFPRRRCSITKMS